MLDKLLNDFSVTPETFQSFVKANSTPGTKHYLIVQRFHLALHQVSTQKGALHERVRSHVPLDTIAEELPLSEAKTIFAKSLTEVLNAFKESEAGHGK